MAPAALASVPAPAETPPEESHRRCIASGERHPKERMIRFVVGPDGRLTPDLAGRLPGRGLWIRAERDMIRVALARGLFAKAAKGRVEADADLVERLEGLLARRIADTLGLARSAGRLVQGFDAIEAALSAGRLEPGVFVAASDASTRGVGKFGGLASDVPLIRPLRLEEMGRALGRDVAAYVAVERGTFSERLMNDAERLAGFRGATDEREHDKSE